MNQSEMMDDRWKCVVHPRWESGHSMGVAFTVISTQHILFLVIHVLLRLRNLCFKRCISSVMTFC